MFNFSRYCSRLSDSPSSLRHFSGSAFDCICSASRCCIFLNPNSVHRFRRTVAPVWVWTKVMAGGSRIRRRNSHGLRLVYCALKTCRPKSGRVVDQQVPVDELLTSWSRDDEPLTSWSRDDEPLTTRSRADEVADHEAQGWWIVDHQVQG